MQEVFREVEAGMKKALEHFQNELKTLRTGRASLAILDSVKVDYYGTPTPLNQVAGLSVADATMITAQPYEPSLVPAIEKAILQSGIGLNPSNDGRVIRIPVPQLTGERRQEMVRRAHDMAESSRNGVRQARREGNDRLKAQEREKEISQDEEHRGHDEIQKLHDKYIAEISSALAAKEADIKQV